MHYGTRRVVAPDHIRLFWTAHKSVKPPPSIIGGVPHQRMCGLCAEAGNARTTVDKLRDVRRDTSTMCRILQADGVKKRKGVHTKGIWKTTFDLTTSPRRHHPDLLPRCYQDRTTQPHLEQCQQHPVVWLLVGLGCLRLDLLNFVNRRSPAHRLRHFIPMCLARRGSPH